MRLYVGGELLTWLGETDLAAMGRLAWRWHGRLVQEEKLSAWGRSKEGMWDERRTMQEGSWHGEGKKMLPSWRLRGELAGTS